MLVNNKDHLELYPAEVWSTVEQKLLSKSSLDPDAQSLRLFFASGSVPAPVDTQGRVNVPGFMRDHASLDNKVIVAGVYDHIEIWNPSRFEEKQANTIHDFDAIQRRLDQAGGA